MTLIKLRQDLRNRRQRLEQADRLSRSLDITRHLSRHLPFVRARRIALYMSTPEEVDTESIIEMSRQMGKELFLPVVNTVTFRPLPLLFAPFDPDLSRLKKNRYGILEPDTPVGKALRGTELPLVCVPMVGFNRQGDRIGMGGGYYDRAFAGRGNRKTHLVGLAFACQEAEFPPEPHDIPMSVIITENGVLENQPGK